MADILLEIPPFGCRKELAGDNWKLPVVGSDSEQDIRRRRDFFFAGPGSRFLVRMNLKVSKQVPGRGRALR